MAQLLLKFRNYACWAIFVLLAGAIAVLVFILRSKNKKLQDLETGLQLRSAKLRLENVLIKYRISTEDLKNIKDIKDDIKRDICQLERELEAKLNGKMTAEEIVAKLKEVGFP